VVSDFLCSPLPGERFQFDDSYWTPPFLGAMLNFREGTRTANSAKMPGLAGYLKINCFLGATVDVSEIRLTS